MRFGLSEKEAQVYLALLKVDMGTAHEIARLSRVNRSSAYVVLESLLEKGLITMVAGNSKRRYVAEAPDKLLHLGEESVKERNEVVRGLTAILPHLKSLYSGSKQRPTVRLYEGKKNIIPLVEEIYHLKEKVMRVYTSGSHMHEFLREFMPEFMKRRAQLGIAMYGIHPDDAANRVLSKYQPKQDRSIFVPPNKYKFTSDFAIYDNTISYISHRGEFAIAIESAEIADAMKSAFDLAFDGGRKKDNKEKRR